MKIKHYSIGLAVIAAATLTGALITEANPLFFPSTSQTNAATSTVAYMTPGTATTTLVVDAYTQGIPTPVLRGALLVSLVGSSTLTQLKIAPEYAMSGSGGTNCVTSQIACDWYQDGGVQMAMSGFATSSKPIDVGTVNYYIMAFASSTTGGAAGSSATTTRAFVVNLPTRYARFVMSLPVGTNNGAVWAQFVPMKEVASNK